MDAADRPVGRRRALVSRLVALAAVLAGLAPAPAPAAPPAAGGQIASGDRHTCLLYSGTVSCWGSDGAGQLGDGRTGSGARRAYLAAVDLGGAAATGIAAGGDRTCAVSATGALYCWGGGYGSRPAQVGTGALLGGASIAAVAAGASITCVLSTGGAVGCWDAGLLPAPPQAWLPGFGGAAIARLTAAGSHACALSQAGAVFCFRAGGPVVPVGLGTTATGVVAGGDRTCALSAGGDAYCWAAGGTARPVRTALGGLSATRLAVGARHACALAASGRPYCWGANSDGQLGDGTTTGRAAPQPVHLPAAVRLVDITAGASHTCGVTDSGAAYCWGAGGSGQLGDHATSRRLLPVPVRGAAVPPGAPGSVSGTGGDGYIDVRWTAPASLGSGALTGYAAVASPGGRGCRSRAATACRITGLRNGRAYTVTVAASTGDGTSARSEPSGTITPSAGPDPPTDVHAEAGDTALVVSWGAPELGSPAPVSRYVATAWPGGARCTSGGTGCTLTGVHNGTTYTVTVVGGTAVAVSHPSAPSNPATPGAPSLPSGVPEADGSLASSGGARFTGAATPGDPGPAASAATATTVTGSGFAPGTPVAVGVYTGDAPAQLTLASSDSSGCLVVDVTLPGDLRGTHPLVARGYAPGGRTRTLTTEVTVDAPAPEPGRAALIAAAAFGVLLFAGGLALLVMALRGRFPGVPPAVSGAP